ncbi:DNA-3-methyladenine glycosylase I [Caballeronia sp. BR00000012568055]|uniref:DNA-3-methyladenine glycosylase I n=1 Tax=Caballeronia sp. BR00000012568055 TaxID=2918761 RepID=UPI0023F6EAB8|nr:DNA-3-methyladenine glycosylase I [Caballeronia sp. BR00000012568055]
MDKTDSPSATNDLVIGEDGLARPAWAATGMLRTYYDTEWGVPVRDERGMFERISLEVFQSGLSWSTILTKREAFRTAFDHFDPDRVAQYGEKDIERLMSNSQIIRNASKISATINNAQATLAMREQGGLADFVWSFKPQITPEPRRFSDIPTSSEASAALAAALRRHGFKFVGPTNMFALMEAIGIVDTHLIGSHRRGSSGVWVAAD